MLKSRKRSNLQLRRTVLMNKITETEAYIGPHDLACRASQGDTERTHAMFGPPGTFYVISYMVCTGCSM